MASRLDSLSGRFEVQVLVEGHIFLPQSRLYKGMSYINAKVLQLTTTSGQWTGLTSGFPVLTFNLVQRQPLYQVDVYLTTSVAFSQSSGYTLTLPLSSFPTFVSTAFEFIPNGASPLQPFVQRSGSNLVLSFGSNGVNPAQQSATIAGTNPLNLSTWTTSAPPSYSLVKNGNQVTISQVGGLTAVNVSGAAQTVGPIMVIPLPTGYVPSAAQGFTSTVGTAGSIASASIAATQSSSIIWTLAASVAAAGTITINPWSLTYISQ